MKDIIRKYYAYPVWEYEQEIQDLDNASRKGLQLLEGGCFRSLFHYDDSVRYVYQLDYQPRLSDKARYLEMFEAQNWEYINSTWNGWHYFRKPYVENMSKEERHIYTDRTSLLEMQNRYLRLLVFATIYACLMGLSSLVRGLATNFLALVLESSAMLLLGLCTGYGIYATRCRQRGKSPRFIIPGGILLLLVFVLLILSFLFLLFF